MEILNWLQDWYKRHCDGDWEHAYGVKIDNIDNPGWMLAVDLVDTELEYRSYENNKYDHGDEEWRICVVRDGRFEGHGDPDRLIEILEEFKRWAES